MERFKRLKEDPRVAEYIERFNQATTQSQRLESGLALAEFLIHAGRNEQARQALDIAREYAKSELDQAGLMRREAELLFRESRYEEAALLVEKAIVKMGRHPNDLELFRAYRLQAMVYFRQGYVERARSFADGAQAVLTSLPEAEEKDRRENELAWAEFYHLMALLDGAAGDHDNAVRNYDREIEILEGLNQSDRLGSVYNNISGLLKTHGRLGRSLEYQLKSYQLASQGDDLLSLAISCNNLGEIYLGMGDLENAQDYYEQYLGINKRIANRVGDAFGLAGLARISLARGDMERAEAQFREAIEAAREVKSMGRQASLLTELADLLSSRGRQGEATQALDQAIAICLETQSFNSQRHQIVGAGIKLAQALESSGAEREVLLRQAKDLVEGALASPLSVEDEEPYSVGDLEREAHRILAEVASVEGSREKAMEEAGRAWEIVERSLELLPDRFRPLYLSKPEIREIQELRKRLETRR